MMEHAQPIEPVSNTASEGVLNPATRETTPSLFSLHEEVVESGDLSFSNCSDKPALTLVLPEEASIPGEDAEDPALALVDTPSDDAAVDSIDTDEVQEAATDIEKSIEAVLLNRSAMTEPVAEPAVAPSPATVSPPSSIFSTADLRPISRPSRFILPDEAPPVAAPAGRIELPKPVVPVVAAPAADAARPAPAPAPVIQAAEPAAAPEKKAAPPVRVGSGQLQPTKLNWKPGEPFGDSAAASRRFRWELMLTTACGTAACGLAGIWLLRTLLS